MVGGIFSQAGYFVGNALWPGRDSNPKGFFEDREINDINETLLAQVLPARPSFTLRPYRLHKWLFLDRPTGFQRWLSYVPVGTQIPSPLAIIERIKSQIAQRPYCFKDPRFCYTLPVWQPYLDNTVFVCVFRDPASTVESILKECRSAEYLHDLRMTRQLAIRIWTQMYKHVLEKHRHQGEWLFIHYSQVLTTEGLDRLQSFTGAVVDRRFPDPSLRRTVSHEPVPRATGRVYQELCKLAKYSDES